MTNKERILIGMTVLLLGVYVFCFTDWLKRPAIHIRQAPPRLMAMAGSTYPAAFDLMTKYQLTTVKVIPLLDGKFNKFTPPVWSLVTRSNSTPTKGIIYGMAIPGMTVQTNPQPLKPGVAYRLVVEAGSVKGEVDFKPVAVAQSAQPAAN